MSTVLSKINWIFPEQWLKRFQFVRKMRTRNIEELFRARSIAERDYSTCRSNHGFYLVYAMGNYDPLSCLTTINNQIERYRIEYPEEVHAIESNPPNPLRVRVVETPCG